VALTHITQAVAVGQAVAVLQAGLVEMEVVEMAETPPMPTKGLMERQILVVVVAERQVETTQAATAAVAS
jgi:hypothetical protein